MCRYIIIALYLPVSFSDTAGRYRVLIYLKMEYYKNLSLNDLIYTDLEGNEYLEEWIDIKEYEGLYKVSNLGRVKSLNFKGIKGFNMIMKVQVDLNLYLNILLYNKGKNKQYRVHRLVAFAFILNPENKPFINHINGVRSDNKLENLEWCTKSENEKHKFDILGYMGSCYGKFGKNHNRSKPIIQYDLNGKFIQEWECARDINRKLGIDYRFISMNCLNKTRTCKGFIFKYI